MGRFDTRYNETGQGFQTKYVIVDDHIKKIIPLAVHSYSLTNYWGLVNNKLGNHSDDDYLLTEWIESEKGQWVIKRTQRTPELVKGYHATTYETMVQVVAFLYEEDATMFHLKWS
jgi:hypothetical protein